MEEMYQPQEQPMPYPYPVDSGGDMTGLMTEWLDVEQFYEEIEHKLKGEKPIYRKDKEGKTIQEWSKNKKPLLNEYGTNEVMTKIRFVVDKNTFLSCISDTQIATHMKRIIKSLKDLVGTQYREFALEKLKMDNLVDNIESSIYFALNRAKGALTVKTLGSKTNIVHQRIERPEMNERRGFLNIFKRRS